MQDKVKAVKEAIEARKKFFEAITKCEAMKEALKEVNSERNRCARRYRKSMGSLSGPEVAEVQRIVPDRTESTRIEKPDDD